MKRAFCLLWVCISATCLAQDLIVTPEGDSLNCKITKVKGENIYFTFTHKGEVRSSLISRAEARGVQYGYYKSPAIPVGIPKPNDAESRMKRWRFSALAGYGYRLGSIPSGLSGSMTSYLSELKSGFTWAIEGGYSFSDNIYLDVAYRMFRSSNSSPNQQITDPNGNVYTGQVSDDISIGYIGPVLGTRLSPGKRGAWIFDMTIGYMQYTDRATIGPVAFRLEGATFGYGIGIGYEYPISAGASLGLKIDASFGRLREFTFISSGGSSTLSLGNENAESLARLDFMALLILKK